MLKNAAMQKQTMRPASLARVNPWSGSVRNLREPLRQDQRWIDDGVDKKD